MIKTRQIGTLVLGFFLIASLIQCQPTQEKELKPQLDSYFEQQVCSQSETSNEDPKPGLSVIITKKDSILYKGNFGSTNLDDKSPITETTIFDIASASKQFTGMAIALLEEKGEIDMNDKIITYLPDLPEAMRDITVYQLVHHSSGIRDWPTLFALKGWQPEEPLSPDDIYEMLKNQNSLNFAPGTGFSYSNSNYNLLAQIVEAVTDTTFGSWMQDHVFVPLDMKSTYVDKNGNHNPDHMANSYVYYDNNYFPFSNKLNAPGSSSLRSNASDLSKWMINFYRKGLGGNAVSDRMTAKGSLADDNTIDYGYGLYITEIKDKKAFVHDGAWGGYRSATAFFPEESTGVVILSNDGAMQPKNMLYDIYDILFGNDEENEEKSTESEVAAQEINDEFFALCAGKYEQVDDKGCYLTFFKEDNEYFVNFYDKNYKLYAKSDSVFFVKEAEVELVFHLRNGEVNSHTLKQNGNNYLALRVEENKKEPNINYDMLIGIYHSKELDVKYKLTYENSELKIQSPVFAEDIKLEHSNNLTFTSNSGLMQSVSFLKEDGAITSLAINNPRAKNLLFEKVNQ